MKCPFCEKDIERFKTNSHIVPKWMYKLTFEGNKSFGHVDLLNDKFKKVQDGIKSSFICDACEELFEKDDTFASLVFVPRDKETKIKNISEATTQDFFTEKGRAPSLILTGVDFKKIQKFVFGVFLRGYLSRINASNPVLGPKHFKNVRKMYLDETDMDDISYPILIYKVDPKDELRNIVHLPSRGKDFGYGVNVVGFTGGGFEFYIIVQSHKALSEVVRWRLSNKGELIIPYVWPSRRKWAVKNIEAARAMARKTYPNHTRND